MTRARKNSIVVISNGLGGKIVDMTTLADGFFIAYDETNNEYVHVDVSTLVVAQTLFDNNSVGSGSGQVAAGDHDHEIGDMVLIFNNSIV
jgi:hypothetical protein